jgi:hypothetical protein
MEAFSTRGAAMTRHRKATTSSAEGGSASVSTFVSAPPSAPAQDRNAPSATLTSSSRCGRTSSISTSASSVTPAAAAAAAASGEEASPSGAQVRSLCT